MEYRALAEDDIERCAALEAYAFRVSPDRADLQGRIGRFRGLFAGGELLAQLELIPLRLRTGLGEVAAGGVGSVAGAPETRRRGHVAALVRHLAEELRAAGVPLCVLFPFKRSFYGRYGWATFVERRVYSGPPERFAPFRHGPGGFVDARDQVAELDRIYRGALRGRFGPIVRDEAWWRQHLLADGQGRPRHAFIWRDATGAGRSYLIYDLSNADDHRERMMAIREIVALDPEARAQLFAFIADHDSQLREVRFRAPIDAPVNALFPDPLDCQVEPHFMLRLLDVPAALAALPYPAGLAGRLSIAVRDAWMPENQGVYEVEIAGGAAEVKRLPDDAPAGISCDVAGLAQLVSRYIRPRTAAAFGLISAERAALDLAEAAFAGLAPFCSDFF